MLALMDSFWIFSFHQSIDMLHLNATDWGGGMGKEDDVKEPSIEELTDEAMKLLRMEIDPLYATLGAQLSGYNMPSRVAGMVSYLSAIQRASSAHLLYNALPPESAQVELRGLGAIYENLKAEGIVRFSEMREDLHKALCGNEEIMRLSEEANRSFVQILVTVVGATLRMPRRFDPVSVTIVALLIKIGLRNFCSQS